MQIGKKWRNKRGLNFKGFFSQDEFIQRLSLDRLGYQNFFGPIPLPDFTLNTEEIAERNQVLMRANLFLASSSKTPQAYDSKGAERKRLMHTGKI